MLTCDDTLVLPPGVTLGDGRLHDRVRGASWPVNATAAFVLERSGHPLGSVADALAVAHGASRAQARADVLAFVWALNEAYLANVLRGGRRLARLVGFVRVAVRLTPAARLPALAARRRALDTRSLRAAAWSCAVACAARGLVVACLACVPALPLSGGSPSLAVTLAASTALGLVVHEAGHAAALLRTPAALVTHGRRTVVLHGLLTSRRTASVALAGPGVAAAAGVAVTAAGALSTSLELAIAGLPLAAHAAGLTVLATDGRRACGL